MLHLFQSIFGSKDQEPYPDELIERGIERAVDSIDPRLRGLPGYQKKLRSAVTHAIDHVVNLVDTMPAPLQLKKSHFISDPELTAYFGSPAQMHELLTVDHTLNKWLVSHENKGQSIVMLMLMELHENKTFGMESEIGLLRRDVMQTTVNFSQHRLIDPANFEKNTRWLLKRRAYDHLLSLALKGITTRNSERAELERERSLLRHKYDALANAHWGFDEKNTAAQPDPQNLQQQLEKIESQLLQLGAGFDMLNAYMDIVVNILMQAEKNFWSDESSVIINRMHVKQTQSTSDTLEINLRVLHNSAGRTLIARLVTLAQEDLPPRRDFLQEAQRYLG